MMVRYRTVASLVATNIAVPVTTAIIALSAERRNAVAAFLCIGKIVAFVTDSWSTARDAREPAIMNIVTFVDFQMR